MYPTCHPAKASRYTDRYDAGHVLAEHLALLPLHDAVILALARDGVPVGFEVAAVLHLPLDVVVLPTAGKPHDAELQSRECRRREREYRGIRPAVRVAGRDVVLVDDGLATAGPMEAAVKGARALKASRVIVAAPVGAPDVCWQLMGVADEVVCPLAPTAFRSVGAYYDDFRAIGDAEVRRALDHVATPLSWSA